MKYPLSEVLPDCTEEEIDRVFDTLDEWADVIETPFTLDRFYAVFPSFSGSESEVIFNSWRLAKSKNVVK